MATKRKISIRKVLQALVTLIVTSSCIVAILGASTMQKDKTLAHIDIDIKNGNRYPFIDKDSLWFNLITQRGIREQKTRLAGLDIRGIEQAALRNPWVKQAEIFVDSRRRMQINITQREPVARIFLENGHSYYLDTALHLLPLPDKFTRYSVVVTNVPVLKDKATDRNLKSDIVKMVRFVERDSFWNAQIAQIIVTPDLKFELVPVLGKQRIVFGSADHMEEKFENLFAFYKNVLNKIGWDQYDALDLRFRNQVIATPAIPWTPGSKNAISNMDWLKNIIEEAPKPQTVATTPPATAAATKPKPAETRSEKAPATKPEPPKATTPPQPRESKKATAEQKPTAPQPAAKAEKSAAEKPAAADKKETNEPAPAGKYIYKGTKIEKLSN